MNPTTKSLIRHAITAIGFLLGVLGLNKYTGITDIISQNLDNVWAAVQVLIGFVVAMLGFFKDKNRLAMIALFLCCYTLSASPVPPISPQATTPVKFYKIHFSSTPDTNAFKVLRTTYQIMPLSDSKDFLYSTRKTGQTAANVTSVLSGTSGLGAYTITVTASSSATVTLWSGTYNYPTGVTFRSDLLSAAQTTYGINFNQAKAYLAMAPISKYTYHTCGPVLYAGRCPDVDCEWWNWNGICFFCMCYYNEFTDEEWDVG